MAIKLKVLEFANKVSRKKMGSKDGITASDPEYRILEPVVTDEMASIALCLDLRVPKSAKEVAALCGKSVEETAKVLWELAMVGVAIVNNIDGEDKYWYDTWIPGIMEMMVNNKENVRKYPQIAESFEAYGRRRGPMTAGNFPVGLGLMRVIPLNNLSWAKPAEPPMKNSPAISTRTIFSPYPIVPAAPRARSWGRAAGT